MAIPKHLSEVVVRNTPPAVDETYMRRALDLAWTAAGHTRPNPMVGAVIVRDGEIVGEGFHERCGEAHGEVVALEAAGERARGGTMYVTLEPCAHHGHTPPCVGRVIASGVRRVVVPTVDPDRRVNGRGIDTLRRAGIRVDVECLSKAAVVQNLCYYKNRLESEPTVTLKMAATVDGKIASAPGRRDDITGVAARRYVHRMRAINDCVVVGVDTVRVDEPALDLRLIDDDPDHPLALPVPVVLDTTLRMPVENRWAAEGRGYIVLTGPDIDETRASEIETGSGRVIRCTTEFGGVSIADAVDALWTEGMGRILVEGGGAVFTSFMRSGCWDALYLFQSGKFFGEAGVPLFRGESNAIGGCLADSINIEGDVLHRFLSDQMSREELTRLADRETEG